MMHRLFAVFTFAPLITATATAVLMDHRQEAAVLEYDIESAYTKVAIPWTSFAGADHFLVFEVQINPAADPRTSDIVLNDQQLDLPWDQANLTRSSVRLQAQDAYDNAHTVDVEIRGALTTAIESLFHVPASTYPGHVIHNLGLEITSVDDHKTTGIGFLVISQPTAPRRLQHIVPSGPAVIDFTRFTTSFTTAPTPSEDDMFLDDEKDGLYLDADIFDLTRESRELRLLENQAEDLRTLILTKKKAISFRLRENRDHESLHQLLKECDGLVCAARVLAQRICDKVSVATDPDSVYAKVQISQSQRLIDFDDESEKAQQDSQSCTKSSSPSQTPPVTSFESSSNAQAASLPIRITKQETALTSLQAIDLINPSNPLIRALQIVAAALGLTALCAYIRKRCMSIRRRVERAADREERRNARAYRRAARRAYMRKRWDDFIAAVDCFRALPEARMEDYEEKRALILQDAFLEQLEDLEQAEKGEVMEAEIRQLRHTREIVQSLVRGPVPPSPPAVHDPPPPLVPLPYTPTTRSRASTHTLPSYTSEILPDYSSQPATLAGSIISISDDSSTPGHSSDDEDSYVAPASTSSSIATDGGSCRRYTPTSSVVETSPRVSDDTLRTRTSRDTQSGFAR